MLCLQGALSLQFGVFQHAQVRLLEQSKANGNAVDADAQGLHVGFSGEGRIH